MKFLIIVVLLYINLFALESVNNSSFVDFVRYVSLNSNRNILIDESIDSRFTLTLPRNFKSTDSFNLLKFILKKHKLRLVKLGTIYYIDKAVIKKKYLKVITVSN